MNLENPYQPSQIAQFQETATAIDHASTPELALGPEWRTVCAGARKCFAALIAATLSVLLFLVYVLFIMSASNINFARFLPLFMIVLGIAIWTLQLIGQIQLAKVGLSSGAKNAFTGSLIAFVVSWGGLVLFAIFMNTLTANQFGVARPRPQWNSFWSLSPEVDSSGFLSFAKIVINFIQYAWFISLLIGLQKLGIALKNSSIKKSATVALVIYSIFVGIGFLELMADMLDVPIQLGHAPQEIKILLTTVVSIGGLVLIACYGIALKKIANYLKSPQRRNYQG